MEGEGEGPFFILPRYTYVHVRLAKLTIQHTSQGSHSAASAGKASGWAAPCTSEATRPKPRTGASIGQRMRGSGA